MVKKIDQQRGIKMSDALGKLFELRKSLQIYEQELGIHNMSDIERSVLEFIIHKKQSSITTITKDRYFKGYSLSTIKRAVGALLDSNIITSTQSENDKRAMVLEYNH